MPTAGTNVRYGDVLIANALTREFVQETVFDDSDTDRLYQRFTVRVVGYLHDESAWNTTFVSPQVSGSPRSAAATHALVRRKLSEPRQAFEMKLGVDAQGNGGQVLLSASPASRVSDLTDRDVRNGPRCTTFAVTHVASDTLLRVEATFVICKLECDEQGGRYSPQRPVLSNRWTVEDAIDGNLYTTRTYNGKLVLAAPRFTVDAFRDLVVPPLQAGLRRERMQFLVAADGLSAAYTIVDQESTWAPPPGATGFDYRYTESIGSDGGYVGTGEVAVALTGARDANRKVLARLAVHFIEAKLFQNRGVRDNAAEMVEMFSVSETSGSHTVNRVEAFARVKHVTVENPAIAAMISAARMGTPISAADWNAPAYNPDRNPGGAPGQQPILQGPIPLAGAFIPYLQCPCCDQHGIARRTERPTTVGGTPGDYVPTDVRVVPTTPDAPVPYETEAHLSAMYVDWQLDSIYRSDGMRAHLPIARRAGYSGGGDDGSTSATVRLGLGHAYRVVRLRGARVGAPPPLPAAVDYTDSPSSLKSRILKQTTRIPTVERTADGKEVHTVEAEYVFGLNRMPTAADAVRIGLDPRDNFGMRRFTANHFSGAAP